MKFLLSAFVLSVIAVSNIYGQNLILTNQQNEEWLKTLRVSSKENQLFIIKSRILADTNVYVIQQSERVMFKPDKYQNRVDGVCKPIFIFEYNTRKSHVYSGNVFPETPDYITVQLSELLTRENIQTINILDDKQAKSQFGSLAACGVIVLKTNNKAIIRLLKAQRH